MSRAAGGVPRVAILRSWRSLAPGKMSLNRFGLLAALANRFLGGSDLTF